MRWEGEVLVSGGLRRLGSDAEVLVVEEGRLEQNRVQTGLSLLAGHALPGPATYKAAS